ncbi:hypothetical protein [Nocardia miyunensis]|uniref:hypothetical protein n=1 Tax=Nocardia miyunensis TaxID=282684 RepID=UPI000A8DE9F3|nr:hypothetical protein [Nocardia miyunensis]
MKSEHSTSGTGRHTVLITRALPAHALSALHQRGIETASTETDESNALFEGLGAERASSNLELVLR